ncbi:MAG TPA: flagellar motor protein MotB [Chthoniobacterales bacterium]
MKKKEEAHHGGAWKVAYADFVTAMMALFMVLWISAQDKQILLATSSYFKQPFNALSKSSIGVMKTESGGSRGKDKSRESAAAANLSFLTALARELNRMLNVSDVTREKPVDMEVTSDGLKVTLYDRQSQPLFEKGTATFTDWGTFVMQNLAWLADRNHLRVTIDGHTASGFVPTVKDYGPWELSADRANASRRLLEFYAVDPKKIERVSGYGETKPLPNLPPDSESNQRITISLNVNK